MEINLLFFFTVVPAIILYGIAKSGLGGSMTLISVPLMTIVMPLSQALGIILPILIFGHIGLIPHDTLEGVANDYIISKLYRFFFSRFLE